MLRESSESTTTFQARVSGFGSSWILRSKNVLSCCALLVFPRQDQNPQVAPRNYIPEDGNPEIVTRAMVVEAELKTHLKVEGCLIGK